MARERASSSEIKRLPSFEFDANDPNGWYRYVADSLVLTGLSRRWPDPAPLRASRHTIFTPFLASTRDQRYLLPVVPCQAFSRFCRDFLAPYSMETQAVFR